MHNGQTMVIEKLGDPEDLREENTDLRTRNPDLKSSAAYRLSFFTAKFATRQRIAHVTDKDFIGYAVVKEDSAPSFGDKRRVYESVNRVQIVRHGGIQADALPFGLEVAFQPFKGGKGVAGLAGVECGSL